MADDIAARDRIAILDLVNEPDDRRDLRVGKGHIAPFVPRIDDLDPDARRINVADPAPMRLARVPGALVLRHPMGALSVLAADIVRRNQPGRAPCSASEGQSM